MAAMRRPRVITLRASDARSLYAEMPAEVVFMPSANSWKIFASRGFIWPSRCRPYSWWITKRVT